MSFHAIRIHPEDNTAVVVAGALRAGQTALIRSFGAVRAAEEIAFGHKIALEDIPRGSPAYKYGYPFGVASRDIRRGEWVHTHNVASTLEAGAQYAYRKDGGLATGRRMGSFLGYPRKNGEAGVRNELWILPMVSCVNHTAKLIERAFYRENPEASGVYALEQPYGCSQLGEDHQATVTMLRNIAVHPNAGGVLLLSLGCENNVMAEFVKGLPPHDPARIRCLVAQDPEDEIAEGVRLLEELYALAARDERVPTPFSKLRVGFKCGASDGFSGVTANPLAGRVCELLVENGAAAVLTETPEMFGAEQILMNHAGDEARFLKIVSMIEQFKAYFRAHGQQVDENPSPGNKAGGITTLEEKSLGCVQKGGRCEITDVLSYGQRLRVPGLTLLSAPGNDPVSVTAMAASGCQLLLFTTGRGNPLGGVVPTVKIASNSALAERKRGWIDFDAGALLRDAEPEALAQALYALTLACADGAYQTRSEAAGYKDIGLFKDGVIL